MTLSPLVLSIITGCSVFLGAFTQVSSGFGYALITMSILPFFMPVKMAAAVILPPIMVSMATLSFRLRRHIDWRMFLMPLPAIIIGRTLGIIILEYLADDGVRLILGILLLLLCVFFFFFRDRVRLRANVLTASGAGLISGLFGGLANISGPPMVIYFLSAMQRKESYIATLQISFLVGSMYTLSTHIFYGNVTPEVMRFWGVGLAGVAAGSFLGYQVFRRINKKVITRVVYGLMAAAGLFMIIL